MTDQARGAGCKNLLGATVRADGGCMVCVADAGEACREIITNTQYVQQQQAHGWCKFDKLGGSHDH